MGQSSIVSTDTKLLFEFAHQGLSPDKYIDVAQCLSLVNRRSYRQGMNYAIGSIEVFSPSGGRVYVSTVPTTWVADNATTKAFEFWKAQRAEVLKEQPSLKAKWSDFKVFMDSVHSQAGVAGNLIPANFAHGSYLLGDWDASEIVFPVAGGSGGTGAANQQTMHVVGDNIPAGNFQSNPPVGTSFSLIEAYANSRRTPQSPDPSTTGVSTTTNPYATLAAPDATFQDIAENVLEHNNEAPYDLDDYPGGELNAPNPMLVDVMIIRNWGDASTYSSDATGSFVAPLGLLKISSYDFEESTDVTVIVNLVPGKYKGVLAERGL